MLFVHVFENAFSLLADYDVIHIMKNLYPYISLLKKFIEGLAWCDC